MFKFLSFLSKAIRVLAVIAGFVASLNSALSDDTMMFGV